jgi:hypothetical protein
MNYREQYTPGPASAGNDRTPIAVAPWEASSLAHPGYAIKTRRRR